MAEKVVDHLVLSSAKMIANDPHPNVDPTMRALADAVLMLSGYEGPSDDMHYPMTKIINPLSDQPVEDHKALVIRLELMSWEYRGADGLTSLCGLVQQGILHRQERVAALEEMLRKIRSGDVVLPQPLTSKDIERAVYEARREVNEGNEFLKKIIDKP